MRNGLAWFLVAWFCGAGHLLGQESPATKPSDADSTPEKTAPATAAAAPASVNVPLASGCAPTYRVWAQAEYLSWWVRNGPLPVPIVTTGDPNVGFDPTMANTVNTAGAIGQPGTRVLLGGSNISFPASSGGRLTLGSWFGEDSRLGVEGSGFVLGSVSNHFSAASDNAGFPPLYFPIFSAIAGAERGIPIADPLRAFSGNVAVDSTLQLWGAEGNVMCTIYRKSAMDFTVLAGFRTVDLKEDLQIHNTTKDLLFGNVTTLNDSFRTSNQFYGGQFGSRVSIQGDWFSLDLTGKVAVGSAHQIVDIQGNITQLGPNSLVPPGLGTFAGGLFAQSTNIGRANANPLSVPFMVLPSLELKLAFQITQQLRTFAGYDYMFLTQVLRPGNQIDHNVNLSQNAVLDPNGVGTLVGAAQPALLFKRSDFWAQGVNVGLEFRY
jgi:hypothetical protein